MKAGKKYTASDGLQYFMSPFTDIFITQGSGGSFSHRGTMANDVRGIEPGVRYPYYAPCDVECIWTMPEYGQAMWRSLNRVHFSNGNVDYATFVTVHDNTFNVIPGQRVSQGEQLGNMGDKGNATGVHCHIEIAQHRYDLSNWKQNQYGIWCFPNETDTDDCYFVDDTNIIYGMSGNWKTIPIEKKKIKYRSHIENIDWQEWKTNGETSGTTGQGLRLEAIQIDYDKEVFAKAHIENLGWVDYGKITKDTVIGTTGKGLRLECLCLKGDFKYRLHLQDTGWTCWTNADGICTLGSVGQSLRIEAIEIKQN